MSIVRVLCRIFRQKDIGPTPAPIVTLWDVLRTYVSDSELARIHAATPDRRLLVGAVARSAGLKEDAILRDWSKHRGLEYRERIPPADFTVLESPLSSELLGSYGATVVTESDHVVGIVCIDPERIEEIRERFVDVPVMIARWEEVRRHLEDSTRAAEEVVALRIREAAERLRETAATVLNLVIHDVLDRGLSAVTIDLATEDSSYTIRDEQGKQLSGSIHPMLQPALKEILSVPRLDVLMPSGRRCPVEVAQESGIDLFHLRWREQVKSYLPDSLTIEPSAAQPADGDSIQSVAKTTKGAVFVIDDNPEFREIVRRFLDRHGFDVRTLESAEEAWSALQEGAELDLIVCDVHMPGMDGYDFVRRLRANAAGREVPLIALTSDDEVETEIRLIRAGVSAFVSKSADPRILCAHVERWCEESRR